MDNQEIALQDRNKVIPDGKYVVRFYSEFEASNAIGVNFEITVGPHKGTQLLMMLNSKKAERAIKERSGDWVTWLAYDGDAKATAIEHAISQGVQSQFLVTVKDGLVKTVHDPNNTFESIYRHFSTEWIISENPNDQAANLLVCKTFYAQADRMPKIEGEWPKERRLRIWLNKAINPNSALYLHEAKQWFDNIYVQLCNDYNKSQHGPYSSLSKWLGNHGFECMP